MGGEKIVESDTRGYKSQERSRKVGGGKTASQFAVVVVEFE